MRRELKTLVSRYTREELEQAIEELESRGFECISERKETRRYGNRTKYEVQMRKGGK